MSRSASQLSERDRRFLDAAVAEAEAGWAEGGIPIGAALVSESGEILGQGRNRRVQHGSAIRHGEMDALENAGRLAPDVYARSTLYTTLSPCPMCSGAALLYKIPRIVIGENRTFHGAEDTLAAAGVEVVVADDPRCRELMRQLIREKPGLWHEDIGQNAAS